MVQTNGEKHEGSYVSNQKQGSGWWRFTNGKVRPGLWANDKLEKWTGPEQFEAQMRAKKAQEKKKR